MYGSYGRRRSSGQAGIWVAIAVAVLLVFAIGIPMCSSYLKHRNVSVVVNDKERVCSGNNHCKYLIYTDHGTFKITDSLFAHRFSSSDAYGKIKRCHKYDLEVYGWRLPALSDYPNVISATDKGRDPNCTVE
jgi:hypothetical protein